MKKNSSLSEIEKIELSRRFEYISTYIFFIGIFFLIFRGVYLNSSLSVVYSGNQSQYLAYVAFLLLGISILTKKNVSIKWILIGIFAFSVGILIYYFSEDNIILLITMIALSSKNIDLKKIIKYIFIITTFFFLSIIILNSLSILPNIVTYKNGIARNSFGFLYTSGLSAYISFIFLNYILIRREKFKLIDLSMGVIVSLIIFYLTRVSQDSLLIIGESILIYLINFEKKGTLGKIVREISVVIVPLSISFVLIASYMFNTYSVFWVNLDAKLSGRLYLGRELISNYPVKAFGQKIPQIGSAGLATIRNSGDYWTQYFYIDSSYLRLIYMYGIFSLVIISIFYVVFLKKVIHHKDSYLAIAILVIAIGGITGQYLSQFSPNFLWAVIFATYSYSRKKERKSK